MEKRCLPIHPIGGWVGLGPVLNGSLLGYFRRTEEPHGGINALLPVEAGSDAASGIPSLRHQSLASRSARTARSLMSILRREGQYPATIEWRAKRSRCFVTHFVATLSPTNTTSQFPAFVFQAYVNMVLDKHPCWWFQCNVLFFFFLFLELEAFGWLLQVDLVPQITFLSLWYFSTYLLPVFSVRSCIISQPPPPPSLYSFCPDQ